MSAPTYTVTAGRDCFFLKYNGISVDCFATREAAEIIAKGKNATARACAMLALLIESQAMMAENGWITWREKRDTLIAKITGKP